MDPSEPGGLNGNRENLSKIFRYICIKGEGFQKYSLLSWCLHLFSLQRVLRRDARPQPQRVSLPLLILYRFDNVSYRLHNV